MVVCRVCEEEINQATEVCPHCGADLTVVPGQESAPGKKPGLAKALLGWGLMLAVLMGALWSFLWFVVSPRTGRVALESETNAVLALGEVRAALNEYAATQGGAYPQSLETLGQPVRQAAQLAQSDGYRLQYTPGPPGADGAIRTYSLEARAGNYGFRNFFVDATGVVHATGEDRSATGLDPALR